MPTQTQVAVTWALQQTYNDVTGTARTILKDDARRLVDKVREYLNTNSIAYNTFSYADLAPYLL